LPKTEKITSRHDGLDHWIVQTENDKHGKPSRRNCKQCHMDGKKEMKATFKCEKCDAPLHVLCFKEGFIVRLGYRWTLVRFSNHNNTNLMTKTPSKLQNNHVKHKFCHFKLFFLL
jgi:hypothetical protein